MGFLKKLFGKTKYKPKRHIKMEETSDKKIYVWTKSERAGKIVTEDQVKDGWLYFTDGSRINPKLTNEFLQLCDTMDIAEETSSILLPSIMAKGVGKNAAESRKNLEEPKESLVAKDEQNSKVVPVTGHAKDKSAPNDIITGIVSKLSKKKKTSFDIKIGVNVPGKTVFSALKEELGEEELLEGLENHIENQINNIIEDIKNQVKIQISKNYE